MDYKLKFSLQQFSAVQLTIQLWKANDIREELAKLVLSNDINLTTSKLAFYDRKVCANKILQQVTSKVSNLPLPELLKNLIFNCIKLIGNQISTTYLELFSSGTKPDFDFYFERLHWTPFGTVDKQTTVESFLIEKSIPISKRYVLACQYCCKECDLWNQCSSEMRDFVKSNRTLYPEGFELLRSWDKRKEDLRTIYHSMNVSFWYQKRTRCLTDYVGTEGIPFKRFWSHLSDENRAKCIQSMADRKFRLDPNCCTEIVFFFINEMNSTQRTKFFELNCVFITKLVSKDPLRREDFPETARLMHRCIPKSRFCEIFKEIAKKGTQDFADFEDCQQLFAEAWIGCSKDLKGIVLQNCPKLIKLLIGTEDGESILLVSNEAFTDLHKERLCVGLKIGFMTTPLYIQKEDFDYFINFARKMKLSEEDINFCRKAVFYEENYYYCTKFASERRWDMLDKFMNFSLNTCHSNPDLIYFKRTFAHAKGLEVCHPWLVSGDYFAIDEFVNWCFASNVLKTEFKMVILQPEVISSLESGDTEMADIFYNYLYRKLSSDLTIIGDFWKTANFTTPGFS